MSGISTGSFGTYNDSIPSGMVVNKKDMPIFRMNLIENVNYFSSEIVNSNKFQAKVLENGWDGKLNQLRVDSGSGELEIGSKLFGQESRTNGTIESFNTFIMNSTLGVSRDKVGNIDNSVGILNEFQQRISDNFYYQKFSYSIKGDIPYSLWKESVRSLIHPSGFKEFSDLVIYSQPQQTLYSENNLKPKILDSTSIINVSVDNEISMYDRTNFTKVYEEDSLPDGSVETIYIDDGLILKPYINNKTNKVLKIDDISDQFNGTNFQSLGNRYADASDLLLYNRSFIREEVVGFVTATYPSILANVDWDRTITSEKIGSVIDSIAHDLKYESNNKSTEVGLSYWSGVGTSYVAGEIAETISGLKYIFELSKFIINNVGVQTSYNLSTSFSVSNLTYDNISGIATVTTTAPHLLTNSDYVVLKNIVLSCNSGGGLSTAIFPSLGAGPDGNPSLSPKGFSYKVNVVGVNTFTVNPGISTIPHAYQSGGTVQKAFITVGQEFDLTITKDTSCNSTYNQNCCANQTSAISNLVGIVTSIVGIGTTSAPSNIILPSLTRGGSIVGLSTFKLKNKGKSLFKHIFESNASFIDVVNNKFVIINHNYQSGQELTYQSTNSPIGIATTSYVTGITSSLVKVGNFEGTAILENGRTVAISTSITGISTTLVPAGPNFQQYFSVIGIGTLGTGAEFNVFLTYNTGTGVPIGTSIILNKGGTGYKIGDTVTIGGTYMGGTSPANNLSFIVSKVTPTDVLAQSYITYSNVPSTDSSGATFNVSRDIDGYVSSVDVVNGGVGYSSTSKVSIAGTYVGGTSQDIVTVSPTELGTNILPKVLYVVKLNDNEFRVSGLGTGGLIKLTGIGSGPHSLAYSNPDPSVLISIDGIVQSALRRKSLQVVLSQPVSTATTTLLSISSGISSLVTGDIININNELVVIKSIGIGSTNTIEVVRGAFESISGVHTVGVACSVMSGDFKIIGDTIHFTAAPYGKIGLVGLETGSTFAGRIFSRKLDANNLIDQNIILDDISPSFTGLAATQFSLKSNGNVVTALYNDVNNSSYINNNPLILINNVLQESGVKYQIENNAQNQINFIDGVPKAGKIVKVGITSGFGYQPLLVAAAKVTVSASGTISSVILTGNGGGYRQSPVISVASTIGFGASITAAVGVSGTITGFTIVNAGTGYTSTSVPVVNIGIPTGYSNLPLTYYSPSTGIGQGSKVTVVVGSGSSIISFAIDQPGLAYKVGDVLTATGITTGPNTVTPFTLTVQEVETDKFSGFYPGQFVLFDSIADQFNGFRKRFTLKAIINGIQQQISLKVPEGTDLDITNNIFIYLNDVLQVPGESYTYSGSRIAFTEAPKPNSFCSIFYYRGSSLDVEEIIPPETIKIGDGVVIRENPNDPFDIDQFERVVKLIPNSDQFTTFTYDSLGISTNLNKVRPLTWSKQKHDRIINGVLFPKSRSSLKGIIRPQATLIKNISIDDTSIYVDNAYPIFSDVDGLNENIRDIIVVENRDIEAATGLANVSAASSISSITLVNPGSGYLNDTSPQLFVSSSKITQKDPIFNWKEVTGISPSYQLNSVTFGNVFVGVGKTQAVIVSPDGKTWQNSTIGLATNFDARSVITHQITSTNYVYVSVGSSARVVRAIGSGNSISAWSTIELKELSSVPGIGIIGIINSSYSGTLKEVVYSPSYSTYVTVGTGGSIFTGVGVGTNYFVNKFSQTVSALNSVSFAFNSSINSGYFIAVGNNGIILTSTYGQIWDTELQFTTENLNKVIYAEGRFVIVGTQGTVIRSISQSQYEVIPTNIGVNLVNIKYAYGIYVASDDSQNIYYSLNLSYWASRSTNQSKSVKDFIFTDKIGVDGTYVIVGHGGTTVYAEPVLNRATGNCLVSGGISTSIVVTNGGFGYSQLVPPETIIKSDTYSIENIVSIKVIGDHGKIIGINTFVTGTSGIGTNTPKIEFVLKSETYDNQTLGIGYSSLNVFGVNNSQLIKGDYFIISDSNVVVGHAITGITTSLGGMTNYPASKVGTAVSFIDGVYRVEQVTTPFAGIVTVTCNLAPSSLGNYVQIYKRGPSNTGINTNDFYGNYSWGKIYDFQNRSSGNPRTFTALTDNGIAGLSTSPKIIRTRSLLSN